MVELSFREGVKLRRSLRMAFPSQSALAQVVFDQLSEDLGHLAANGDYGEVLVRLIVWAEVNERTVDLIRAARTGNPGDDLLREFEIEYNAVRPDAGGAHGLPPSVLTPALRLQLVDAVMAIPTSGTFEGRSAYLLGLPMAVSRNPGDALADLNTIFAQLDGLGRLASGQRPLLVVIDNILPYVQGFPDIHNAISLVRQALEHAYSAH